MGEVRVTCSESACKRDCCRNTLAQCIGDAMHLLWLVCYVDCSAASLLVMEHTFNGGVVESILLDRASLDSKGG